MEKYLSAIILAYIVIVAVKNPLFFSPETLFDMIRSGSGVMLLALGVLLVLVSGGIDVSFTAVAIVSSYLSVLTILNLGIDNVILASIIAIAIGTGLGAINALLIHYLKLPTLIVTLGTMSVFHGLMAVLFGTKSYPLGQMPDSLANFGSANLFTVNTESGRYGLTVFLPIVVAAVVGIWFMLNRTLLGRSVYAIGSDEESASRLGISILKVKLFVYCTTGGLAGLMGIIYFSELKYVNPTSLVGTELMVIAAVVIGGAKLTGGEGTVLGTILGVVTVQLFDKTLVFLGLSSSWNDLFFGSVLLASLMVMYRRQRLADRRNLVFVAS
ncbi:ABC transporter permease [Jonesiaceae bacterium BS-20]|uniref:ABC transporter permease n=1 Tax=Jonesiaceae bacterium BS-20 TaxID=3120821 RepID=A0AAU7DUW1_9MICO